jgi:hypothetical protein
MVNDLPPSTNHYPLSTAVGGGAWMVNDIPPSTNHYPLSTAVGGGVWMVNRHRALH